MATQATALKPTARPNWESPVTYFGLTVEVVERMEHYSLIRYRDRERVVGTEDLQGPRARELAA